MFTDRIPRDINASFKPGEFEALVRKAVDTIDLIFLDGIDWKAFLQSFNATAAQYPDDSLAVQGIERKGEQFIIRLETTAPPENRGAIEAFLKEFYEEKLVAMEAKYDNELQWLRQQNSSMMKIIEIQASQQPPSVTINLNNKVKNMAESNPKNITQGDHSRYIETNDSSTYIEGNYYNTSQGTQDLTEVAIEIRQLLERLEQTFNPNTPVGKMEISKAVIEKIKYTSPSKEKVIRAIKVHSTAALESALNHPLACFVINAYKEWQNTSPKS